MALEGKTASRPIHKVGRASSLQTDPEAVIKAVSVATWKATAHSRSLSCRASKEAVEGAGGVDEVEADGRVSPAVVKRLWFASRTAVAMQMNSLFLDITISNRHLADLEMNEQNFATISEVGCIASFT